jgi:hypothetical protein
MLGARIDSMISHLTNDTFPAPRMLLTGDSQTGKTSVAFAYAYDLAANHGGRPLFICNKAKIEIQPPLIGNCLFLCCVASICLVD